MRNVQVLDCTLRDGGRIIDCAFNNNEISQITDKLSRAGVDIIELGFLRDSTIVNYTGNSTFFTDVNQLTPFIPEDTNAEFVVFIDYGMFNFETLKNRNDNRLNGIRVGFTKKDYENYYDELVDVFKLVKAKGYNLYIQGVNSLSYTDIDLLHIVEMVNDVNPTGFGIVDTYGAMYVDDVSRLYRLIDHNLNKNIAIDFHSHNNFQLSFSFAQEIIRLSNGVRKIIIDATLDGIGKEAGNLNTELIVDYLARKLNYDYDTDIIFDAIDEHIFNIREKHRWGYSPNTLLSGILHSHPNNVIYLTQKFRLDTKDIKNILAMLDEQERQRYDYEKLDRLTEKYNDTKYDDNSEIATLTELFAGKPVLVLAPGRSLITHCDNIDEYISMFNPNIISVNFISEYPESFVFFANKKRYSSIFSTDESKMIVTSNITRGNNNPIVVNYYNLINHGYKLFDNSVLMLLNLLKRLQVKDIAIAGMDGFNNKTGGNYYDESFDVERLSPQFDVINKEISLLLGKYVETTSCNLSFITPSIFGKTL